jgi:hypothetical protein
VCVFEVDLCVQQMLRKGYRVLRAMDMTKMLMLKFIDLRETEEELRYCSSDQTPRGGWTLVGD